MVITWDDFSSLNALIALSIILLEIQLCMNWGVNKPITYILILADVCTLTSSLFFLTVLFSAHISCITTLIKRIFWFYIIRCCLFSVNLMTAILVPVPSQTNFFSLLVDFQGGPILQTCPVMTRKVLLPEGCPGGLCSLLGSLWQPPAGCLGSLPCSTDSIMARRIPSSGSSPCSSPSWKVFSSHSP